MLETEKAYIAGIVDGEGSIQIFRRKTSLYGGEINPLFDIFVKINNTDIRMLEWIQKTVGYGKIYQEKKRDDKRRNCFKYQLQSLKVIPFLEEIYPYLVIKKEQADLVFELRTTYTKNKANKYGTSKEDLEFRNRCYEDLKQLHHKEFKGFRNENNNI